MNNRDLEIIYKSLCEMHKEVDKLSDRAPSFIRNPFTELQTYLTGLREEVLLLKREHLYTPKENPNEC